MPEAVFIIHQNESKEWEWHLIAPDDQTIANSCRSYKTESECIDSIEAVKELASSAKILNK